MTLSKKYDEIMDNIYVTEDMRKRILQNISDADFGRQTGAGGQNGTPKREHIKTSGEMKPRVRRCWKQYASIAACAAVLIACVVTLPQLKNPTVVTPPDTGETVEPAQPDTQQPNASQDSGTTKNGGTSGGTISSGGSSGGSSESNGGTLGSSGSDSQSDNNGSVSNPPDTNTPGSGDTEGPAVSTTCETQEELVKTAGFDVEGLTYLPFDVKTTEYVLIGGSIAEITYTGSDGSTAVYRKSKGDDDNSGDYNTYETSVKMDVGDVKATLKGSPGEYVLATWASGKYSYSVSLSAGADENTWNVIISGKEQNN